MSYGRLLVIGFLICTRSASAIELTDDFSDAAFQSRQAERGDWKFSNNVASVDSDPLLYEKYANHGPILKWPVDCTTGAFEFEFKPTRCQRVVFTLNGDGHIFRISLVDPARALTPSQAKTRSRILAWATKSSKQNKGDSLRPKEVPELSVFNGKWTKVSLKIDDGEVALSIGDYSTQIEHPALRRKKDTITLSFADGSLEVRDFRYSSL